MQFKLLTGMVALFAFASTAPLHAAADHLLISKVVFDAQNPEEPAGSGEFIEIYNPTSQPISLDNYILTDLNGSNATNVHKYYNYPELGGSNAQLDFADYMIQFPPGYTLQPNKTAVVTQSARMFLLKHFSGLENKTTEADVINQLASMDITATLQRYYDVPTAQLLFEVTDSSNPYTLGQDVPLVPNMVNRTTNTTATPANNKDSRNWLLNMTNGGEFTALVYYAGGNTPIKDVDIVAWGAPSAAQDIFPLKTGVTVFPGTPDEYIYKTDSGSGAVGGNLIVSNKTTLGIYRVNFSEANEVNSNGNGITGHDESSELNYQSWRTFTTYQDYSWVDTTPPPIPPGLIKLDHILMAERSEKYPAPGAPVTLNARIALPAQIATAKFVVTAGANSSQDFPMAIASPTASESNATAAVGSFPEGTLIKWYAEVTYSNSTVSRFPLSGERSFIVTATPVNPGDIVINEMMYDPFGTDNGAITSTSSGSEWIELYNNTGNEINLSNSYWSNDVSLSEINKYQFPEGTKIAANDYLILVGTKAVFEDRYSSLAIPTSKIIQFSGTALTAGTLGSGNTINIVHINDNQWQNAVTSVFIDNVRFDSGPDSTATPPVVSDWPGKKPSSSGQPGTSTYDGTNSNNGGPTIELVNPTLDNSLGINWKASVNPHIQNATPPLNPRGGTPGSQNSVYSANANVASWALY